MSWTQWPELAGLNFSDLSIMVYMVPLIIGALAALFAGVFLNLSSYAANCCKVCKTCFNDLFDLRRHLKGGHKEKGEEELYRKAA